MISQINSSDDTNIFNNHHGQDQSEVKFTCWMKDLDNQKKTFRTV